MEQEKLLTVATFISNYFTLTRMSDRFDDLDLLYAAIDEALGKMPFIQLDEDSLNTLRLEMQYRYQIRNSDPGHSIQFDYEAPKWYSDKLAEGKIRGEFWNRYKKYLLDKKGFSEPVVRDLEEKTLNEELMNFLADPDGGPDRPRRGLIIGDVQSGKTSTYTGLICKAADAGYKVFIILSGMIESLRVQTQQRIEEGFVGVDLSTGKAYRCGVGEDNKPISVESMTSRKTDFTQNINQIAMTLRGKRAIVFVLKKNTSVLTKLCKWLTELNLDPTTGKINEPMLLIDDEADNASINTSAKEDPTRINGLIRKLVDMFSVSDYVGFTATPFANVFIDPLTVHDMYKHDLFPEDFIVALPTPENYVGASKIFHKDGIYHNQLIYITDAGARKEDGYPFWYLHRKDWDGDLPDSLTDALYAFYLVNAIRDLKGDKNAHRTMMVNMTRFTAVQYRIRNKIELLHKQAIRAIRYNLSAEDPESSLDDPILDHIHRVFINLFVNAGFSWNDIAGVLSEAVEPIELKVINSSKNSDKLIYTGEESQRVVAIGGLALSRGLTLEGLIISYFYRNTSTYDVLMQMGRWFGYRRGYEDLFRIWIGKESAEWYAEIADATEQLKKDMDKMRAQRKRPREFGIRVRDDSDRLEITARNKMRNTSVEYDYPTYYGNCIETPYLSASASDERTNYKMVCRLVRQAISDGAVLEDTTEKKSRRILLRDVSIHRIIELLKEIKLPDCNSNFDTKQILSFLEDVQDPDLSSWDVAFIPGSGSAPRAEVEGISVPMVKRGNCSVQNGRLNIGVRGRLGGSRDGRVGCDDAQLLVRAENQFRADYKAKYKTEYDKDSFTSYTWFRYITTDKRRPLLMLYPVRPESSESKSLSRDFPAFLEALGDIPVFGFAVGIPASPDTSYVARSRFKVNRMYNFYEDGADPDDEEAQE